VIAVGEAAPDFTASREDGTPFHLYSLLGTPTILFFYPRANSLGCTVETRAFADHFAEFQAAGLAVVGVSVDPVTAQKSFAAKCEVAFPLVADTDKSIARAYGVLGFLGFARRVTFFLDAGGRVEEVVEAINPNPHVKRALERIAPTAPSGATNANPPR
jgi:thioredoxin-dependent peroxiredoxin